MGFLFSLIEHVGFPGLEICWISSIYLFIWKYMKSQEIFQSPLIDTSWHDWKQEAYLRYWPRTVLLKLCELALLVSEI